MKIFRTRFASDKRMANLNPVAVGRNHNVQLLSVQQLREIVEGMVP